MEEAGETAAWLSEERSLSPKADPAAAMAEKVAMYTWSVLIA
jgi:hypothetical protein